MSFKWIVLFMIILIAILIFWFFPKNSSSPPPNSPRRSQILNYIEKPSPSFRPSRFLSQRNPLPHVTNQFSPPVSTTRIPAENTFSPPHSTTRPLVSLMRGDSFLSIISSLFIPDSIDMDRFFEPVPIPARVELKLCEEKLEKPVTCPICQEDVNKEYIKLEKCGHCYCAECIRPWFERANTCPVCRQEY